MPQGAIGKKRNIFAAWLGLPIITLGIYGLVWWYKINRELRDFDNPQSKPTNSLLAFLPGGLIIIPPFVSIFQAGKRIRQAQISAGLQPTCSPGLGLFLGFIYGTYVLYYQSQLNKVWDSYPGATEGTIVPLRGAGAGAGAGAPQYMG